MLEVTSIDCHFYRVGILLLSRQVGLYSYQEFIRKSMFQREG